MNKNLELTNYLIGIGVKRLVGVLGSGDSFDVAQSFIDAGGEFLESPTEFSSPIIASAINKFEFDQSYAASISIRGPGLVSSLPGLYHNFIEDLKSLSISESLDHGDYIYNHHKMLKEEKALGSIGLTKDDSSEISQVFSLNSTADSNSSIRMLHLTTRNSERFSYNRTGEEICSDQADASGLDYRKKVLVIGKRGIENSHVHHLLSSGAPYFLTPAALPFSDLNSPNFLGVWTGNEQFKSHFSESKELSESIIIRIGVMKRELLTLRKKIQHYDIPLYLGNESEKIYDFIDELKLPEIGKEKKYLFDFRKNIAGNSDSWSVYSVISILNNLCIDFNYSFDVGSFATIIENYIQPIKTHRLHSSFVGKFMGTAVPISIGISIAEPSIPVLCMLGEGGLAASFSDVMSIANLHLPVCILVFSDGSMHSIVSSKEISTQARIKFLPLNYQILEKLKAPDFPTYYANSAHQFNKILSKWNMRSPIMIFLKFDSNNYAKGVELLR